RTARRRDVHGTFARQSARPPRGDAKTSRGTAESARRAPRSERRAYGENGRTTVAATGARTDQRRAGATKGHLGIAEGFGIAKERAIGNHSRRFGSEDQRAHSGKRLQDAVFSQHVARIPNTT